MAFHSTSFVMCLILTFAFERALLSRIPLRIFGVAECRGGRVGGGPTGSGGPSEELRPSVAEAAYAAILFCVSGSFWCFACTKVNSEILNFAEAAYEAILFCVSGSF